MPRNPFAARPTDPFEAETDKLVRVLTTYLRKRTVAELQAALTARGLPPGLVNAVGRLDDIPEGVLRAIHVRLADPQVWARVQARLGL